MCARAGAAAPCRSATTATYCASCNSTPRARSPLTPRTNPPGLRRVRAPPVDSHASRTFLEYETLAAAMDGVCLLYERELTALNPKMENIAYDISDLYSYLEQLTDVSLLMCVPGPLVACRVPLPRPRPRACSYHEPISAYVPRDKEWLKKQLYSHLRAQAAR